MPESLWTKPTEREKQNPSLSVKPPKMFSRAFNSFQIAQAQFDKVVEYPGLDQPTNGLLIIGAPPLGRVRIRL